MKRSFLLAAAALSAAPAAEARVGPMPRPVEPVPVPVPVPVRRHVTPEVPTNCRITVAFGSYAAGIDGPTHRGPGRQRGHQKRARDERRKRALQKALRAGALKIHPVVPCGRPAPHPSCRLNRLVRKTPDRAPNCFPPNPVYE